MAVTSGFFNSLYGDRKYTAEQFSALFNGLINDGVFSNIGTAFRVSATTDNNISVGIGRAWFNGIWVNNDALLPMTCNDPEVLLDRIDALVIEINRSEAVRAGRIIFVKGMASGTPVGPTLTHDVGVDQYPLAYIRRKAGVSEVVQADITNCIGTSECPYVTGILETQNIDSIVAQWESQFNLWFEGLQTELEGDVAANLASQIISLDMRFDELAKTRIVTVELEDSSLDTIEDSTGAAIYGSTVLGESEGSDEVIIQPIEPSEEFDGFEVGDILTTTRDSIFEDDRWLLCNGATLNSEDYTELASAMIKTPEGSWRQNTGIGPSEAGYESPDNPTDVVYGKGYYVFAFTHESYLCIAYKTSLTAGWSETIISNMPDGTRVYDIVFANGYFVISGMYNNKNAVIWYATDPTNAGNWTRTTLWTAYNYACACSIKYLNGYFIAGGYEYTSHDYVSTAKIAYTTTPNSGWAVRNIKTTNQTSSHNIQDGTSVFTMNYIDGLYVFGGSYKNNSIFYPAIWTCEDLTNDSFTEISSGNGEQVYYLYTLKDEILMICESRVVTRQYIVYKGSSINEIFSSPTSRAITLNNYSGSDFWLLTSSGFLATPYYIYGGESGAYELRIRFVRASDFYNSDFKDSNVYGNQTGSPRTSGISECNNALFIMSRYHNGSKYRMESFTLDQTKIYLPEISLGEKTYTYIKARSE